jgi:MFS family permease
MMMNPVHDEELVANARQAFVAAATALAVLFMGNNLPSALYGVFRAAFGYSSLTQTLLYAAAVAVIVPGLLVFGPLSDVIGRRTLILAGLISFGVGDVLFVVADGTAWLFAARMAQGLGMACASAAGVAALSDSAAGLVSDQVRAQRVAALTATVCMTGGLAFGPLLAGILAQYGPAPLKLSFLVHLALVAIAFVAALTVPDNPATTVGHWHPALLRVPDSIRETFALVAASGFLCWSVLGVFSAVIPSFLTDLFDTRNLVLTSAALALMIATSALAQLGAHRLRALTAQLVGLGALAVGLALLVIATATRDPLLAVLAMVGSGVGHGLIFVGEMTEITIATPPEERGAVISVVHLINYIGLGAPAIGVGFLSLSYGLLGATRLAALVIAVLCLLLIPLVIRAANRTRHETHRIGTNSANMDTQSVCVQNPRAWLCANGEERLR